MPQAFILVGNAVRFYNDGRQFERYLRARVGIKKIIFVDACRIGLDEAVMRLKKFLSRSMAEPKVVFYSGHGNSTWLGLDDVEKFSYEYLAEIFAATATKSRIIFVNQSCHSFAAKNFFEQRNIASDRLSLIASCAEDEAVYIDLVDGVITAWSNSYPFKAGDGVDDLKIVGPIEGGVIDMTHVKWVISHLPRIGEDGTMLEPQILPKPASVLNAIASGSFFRGKRWGTLENDRFFFPTLL